MRLVEIRSLDGPNVYRLEPTIKLEVAIGRRRTWFGQRLPGAHARVRLGAPIPASQLPLPIHDLAAWVRRLHRLTGADGWLAAETRPGTGGRSRVPVTAHRTSEPGHWVIAFPWGQRGRAEAIAAGAYRLVELDLAPGTTRSPDRPGGSRALGRVLRSVADASTDPPTWIRDVDRRMPAVSISGTNGKTTTTRMITHILRASGRRVGTTTSEGVLIDEILVEAGDLTGPLGARSVLERPDVEVAVLETARGGIVLRGAGYESNDASVLTNVSSDHMDLQGLHTLPELAEVKSTIVRMTRPQGVVVLNAEDDLVAAAARVARAPVWWFAVGGPNRRVRRHAARGGTAFVIIDGAIAELAGGRATPIVPLERVPSTLGGIARHNVANALAAAAAARALGATREAVSEGLRTFAPTAEAAPGRLNLYRRGDQVVMVDFAHNEGGLEVALDTVEGLAGDRAARGGRAWLGVIIGTAGDRPDDTLRGIGRMAATRADAVAIKETLGYLRGRTRGSVIGELRAGVASAGLDGRAVPVFEGETAAVAGMLDTWGAAGQRRAAAGAGSSTERGDPRSPSPHGMPGVLLVMCHAEREAVVAVLEKDGFAPVGVEELSRLRDLFPATRTPPGG
jgi:cyanophycin synthetase